ncbi:MAG: ATP-dependent transcriptional regulator [Symbiobacteriaceae bacterium]|jgi:LuxR family maltose regulon positive regulatory protein|nr:ATP-dependent transcriptional regulator [Symbiobacteriaceae bacterium]
MSHPLLTTKLYPPALRPGQVARPRLTDRLSVGLRRPLTLVSAPAGFGKSSLLGEWRAAGTAGPLAWLSLDPGDNDPARFWSYLAAALRTVGVALSEELDAGAPPDRLLAPLINGLDAAEPPVVLVLDDYHTIEAPAIHAAVGFLIEQMPKGLRLVVLTRSDPPWPMARLRAHGLMQELRAADLRFTPDEAAAFLTNAPLAAADVAAVADRTEGWIAALQMVAISLEGHPDPHGFVAAFSGENRFITDYLTEEVLARQPEAIRRFLLQTSLLDRLTAPLCAAVTGNPDARTLLDQIERKGLFLTPLDPAGQWFRYHQLFGDLLRAYLAQTEPELVPALHSRAATWHLENGLPMEAARHALAAGEFDRTVAIIERHAGGWWSMAAPGFNQLLQRLPPAVVRRSPLICTYQAWIFCMEGQMDEALAFIEAAEERGPAASDVGRLLALMRAFRSELCGEPYELSGAALEAPASIPQADFRTTADLTLAYLLYRKGRPDEAAALWLQAAEREMATGSTYAIAVAIPLLARLRLEQGRVDEAEAVCRRFIRFIQERGEAPFFVWGNLRAVLADALRHKGDLAGAEAEAREALRVNRAYEVHHAVVMPLHALARVRLARGAPGEALALLAEEEAATRGRTLSPDVVGAREAIRAEAHAALGDHGPGSPRAPAPAVHLSDREQEILALVAAGRSNQEIARMLFVAVGTVKIHIHNVFEKLEVGSRTQAVARARELHLL